MKITFLGAAKTVTGSCFLVETDKTRFLVDCGMFQGSSKEELLNEEKFPFNPSEIDFILLTHAHIDHSGRIPKIYLDGFRGPVITTKATAELCGIMLPDSGHIQESENEWINRKRLRAGKKPVAPLYTLQDAVDCLKLFKPVRYLENVQASEDVKVRFNDAGHILGSAIIEVWVYENGGTTKLVFTGDLGNSDMPILRDPSVIESADYLIIESTYGSRLHKEKEDRVGLFVDIINETLDRGGNIVIPSFAVGRTQEVIYDLNKKHYENDQKLKKLLNTPVVIDSPLAISATEVFRNNTDCFDREAREYIENGDNPLDFKTLRFTRTADESKALNNSNESMIIISASGMCEAGRIKHHLKHNLWRSDSTVLFIGYQAEGTLGRRILDGAEKVKVLGEEVKINCRIEMIDGFSGHADRNGLLGWIEKMNKKPQKIFIVHGETDSMNEFSRYISERFNIESVIPSRGESYEICTSKPQEPVCDAMSAGAVGDKEIEARENRYKRLELLCLMEKLEEEFDDVKEMIINDLKQGRDDIEVENLKYKFKALEKYLVDIIR
jgi:metallo-beta-lactamase family protein